MYKNNPYSTNTNIELDERGKRIVAKAKKYHADSFENINFAQNLLKSQPKKGKMLQEVTNLFSWILLQENELQMSKIK